LIQLSKLEGFFWVAREGGFAKAARAFPYPITQPGVYQQVKRLEEDLGCALFSRGGGKGRVQLTGAGHHLYSFCAPFFEQLPVVERAIHARSYGGVLRIDGAPMTIRGLLPTWLARLHEARPDIQLSLEELDMPNVERLRRGQADVIVDFVETWPSWVRVRPVARVSTFLVWPRRLVEVAAKHVGLPPDALTTMAMIGYGAGSRLRELQEMGLRWLGLSPAQVITANNADSILAFVAAGLGYTLIPWLDDEGPQDERVQAQRLDVEQASFDIVAAFHEDAVDNPLVDALLSAAPAMGS